jgi:hypothetical protein
MKLKTVFWQILLAASVLQARDGDINVLSYYAVGNSLDGQPLVDKINVLRFFPTFGLSDLTDTVKVTVYYGDNIFRRDADPMEDKRYWQVTLPLFHLGEAIQRIEVETRVELDPALQG